MLRKIFHPTMVATYCAIIVACVVGGAIGTVVGRYVLLPLAQWLASVM